MGKCVSFADEIVALKRLKMEKEKEGFPITSLREINTILKAQHLNIVTVRVRLQSFISEVLLFLKYSSWLLNIKISANLADLASVNSCVLLLTLCRDHCLHNLIFYKK